MKGTTMGQDLSGGINVSRPSENQLDIESLDIIMADKSITRPDPLLTIWKTVQDIVRWPIKFFTLTEEDRLKAGIYTSGEEQDI
jgi:hypothetical protein